MGQSLFFMKQVVKAPGKRDHHCTWRRRFEALAESSGNLFNGPC